MQGKSNFNTSVLSEYLLRMQNYNPKKLLAAHIKDKSQYLLQHIKSQLRQKENSTEE